MSPVELNLIITAITNHLYISLSKEDFVCLNIFISELSKSMFATTLFSDICFKENKVKEIEKEIKKEIEPDKEKKSETDKEKG